MKKLEVGSRKTEDRSGKMAKKVGSGQWAVEKQVQNQKDSSNPYGNRAPTFKGELSRG